MTKTNQFSLLRTRRFFPLFCTQFFGAFNDNLFKNALIVLLAYYGISFAGLNAHTLINIAAGVFILPFFLFSATAGQLAEKMDKARLARYIKLLEIIIMALASIGFIRQHAGLLFFCLFLMGLHSTLFGPLKYSILPQYLQNHELLGGNGMIEMGTFVAILAGQITGTLLLANGEVYAIVIAIMGVAIAGYISSRAMPEAPSLAPGLPLNWNFIRETSHILRESRKNRTVFLSILGISWFWFYGAVYLTQLPEYTKSVLGGDPTVYTLLIALFSIGVATGSLLCEKLSRHTVELGLVPLGSIGLSVFGIDLYFSASSGTAEMTLLPLSSFIHIAGHYRSMADITLIGLFGGIFIVPLYALIQIRVEPGFRSRAIAANNIMNAFFMVIAAGISALLLSTGMSIPMLLLLVSIANIGVALYIYRLLPEFTLRFVVWILSRIVYRIKESGLEQIPDKGGALLVCNHVSYVDALIIAGAVHRPIRFVMDSRIFDMPLLSYLFRTAGAIPIANAKENACLKEQALAKAAQCLEAGELVCIFPEGRLTPDGNLSPFRSGMEQILANTPVPVIPMALQGLWGSIFSRANSNRWIKILKCFRYPLHLNIGKPVPAGSATATLLQIVVLDLRKAQQ